MNKVYQHGDELFVTLDATPRMRNLRTGLTITPRVPFKYLGEMPQVGQVWVGKRSEGLKTVKGFAMGCVQIEFDWSGSTHKGEVPLEIFLENHTLEPTAWRGDQRCFAAEGVSWTTRPRLHFATGDKNPLNAKATDRRFTVAHEQMKAYCMADAEAEAKALYMAPDGKVFRVNGTCPGWVGLSTANETLPSRVVREAELNATYRPLPLPGQLWAKGSRYVTVDRVEDGRVYYTDGSSGLRRFLNEYANVDTYALYKRKTARATFTGSSPNVQQLCKPCHDFKKLEELARGYGGFTPSSEHVVKTAQPESGTTSPLPPRPFTTSGALSDKEAEIIKAVWEHASNIASADGLYNPVMPHGVAHFDVIYVHG